MYKLINITFLLMFVTGCASTAPFAVTSTSEITVESALKSVASGLAAFKKELDLQEFKTGLLVDEVTLNLNLTAKSSETSTLAVDISKAIAKDAAGIGGKLFGYSNVEVNEGTRGSTLTIKLRNSAILKLENPKKLEDQTPLSVPQTGK